MVLSVKEIYILIYGYNCIYHFFKLNSFICLDLNSKKIKFL